MDLLNNLIDFLDSAFPYLSILIAGYLGHRLALKQLESQRKLEFIERQLREFYSPMIGCLKRVRAKSELRLKISQASDSAW